MKESVDIEAEEGNVNSEPVIDHSIEDINEQSTPVHAGIRDTRIYDQPAACPNFQKVFPRRDNMIRHYRNICKGVTFNCKFCKFCGIT